VSAPARSETQIVGKTQFDTPSDRPIVVIRRAFDAPRALVFDAMARPEHLKHWYGPRTTTVLSAEADLRVGGRYRIVSAGPDGNPYAFSGEYLEYDPPRRSKYTWRFEPIEGAEATITGEYEERDGKTYLVATMEFSSMEQRDGYLGAGATGGGAESYERLDELLRTMM
jgi:uncharacterized protein YndB with AHSA1/START domain